MDKDARRKKRAQTLDAIGRLPINPGPLAAIMQADGTNAEALIKALSQCPILTARVIGVANSAASSATHRMDSVERCVHHLGAKQARTVALTMALQLITQDLEVDDDILTGLWGSATTKAVTASMVAQTVSPQQAEQAYCVGLVQDLALPMLYALDPAFFDKAADLCNGRMIWSDIEQERFGIDHAELGALMLEQWDAPPALIGQVRRHHTPLAGDDMAWIAEMPARFAGLLPHLDEKPTKVQAQTLTAAHARLLSNNYQSVDALAEEARKRVKALGKAAGGPARISPALTHELSKMVAQDTFALVAQVARLDRQLAEHVDQLAVCQVDALSDPLTGLLNRRGLDSFGEHMLAQANRGSLSAACLVIDLDDFKPINDNFGHAAGDAILRATADLLRSSVAPGDLVARLGGDEFTIFIVASNPGDAHALSQRIHAACNGRSLDVGAGQRANLKMSIGGVFLPNLTDKTTVQSLLEAADQAMYRCKQRGKSGIEFQTMKRTAA